MLRHMFPPHPPNTHTHTHYFKYDFFISKYCIGGLEIYEIHRTIWNIYIYIYTNRIWNICIPPRFSIRENPSPTPNLRSALDIIHMVPTLFPKRNSRTFQGLIKDKAAFFKHYRIVIWCIVNAVLCGEITCHTSNFNIHQKRYGSPDQ